MDEMQKCYKEKVTWIVFDLNQVFAIPFMHDKDHILFLINLFQNCKAPTFCLVKSWSRFFQNWNTRRPSQALLHDTGLGRLAVNTEDKMIRLIIYEKGRNQNSISTDSMIIILGNQQKQKTINNK